VPSQIAASFVLYEGSVAGKNVSSFIADVTDITFKSGQLRCTVAFHWSMVGSRFAGRPDP